MRIRWSILLLLCLLVATGHAWAASPDYEREQRLADEFVDGIVVGDAIELSDGQREFVGILTEAETEQPRGAVLIVHGRGYHPAWPTVIQPVRTELPEQGWTTLSIQMPVLGKEAKYFDYVPLFPESHKRISAGLKYLREQGFDKVVLLAHSCGAHMAMSYIGRYSDSSFDAYVAVGAGATDYKQPMVGHFPYAQMRVPILDIYGGVDFPAVLRKAPERRKLMERAGNAKSRQIVVAGADHYYKKPGDTEKLIENIIGWLGKL